MNNIIMSSVISPVFVIVALFCIAAYIIALKTSRRATRSALVNRYKCKDPPKPNLDFDSLNFKASQDHNYLQTSVLLFSKYGKTYKTARSGRTFIRTCDPAVMKAVLATQFDKFGLQPLRYEGGKGFFGRGILVTDGPQWKHSRALIRPAFDIAHIANFDRLERHVKLFMDILPRDGSTIDLFPLFKRLTLDISSEFIFGQSMDALSSPEASQGFIDAFVAAQRDVVIPPEKRPKDYNKWCKEVWDYIDVRIDEALLRIQGAYETPITGRLRLIDELAKTTQDKHSIRDHIVNIFSPAHDVVAVTLTNALFHLARNPSCWAKLRAEVLPTSTVPLTYELLNSFKHLNSVLRETHRLTPLNSGTVRTCLSTTVLPLGGGDNSRSPLLVEEGDLIETNWYASHRDKAFWGDDAETFRPERWDSIRPTWQYTPFSGGPRICPAIRLVYSECEYILVTLVRAFSAIENRDEVMEWVEERRLIFQSRNGAKVGLIP